MPTLQMRWLRFKSHDFSLGSQCSTHHSHAVTVSKRLISLRQPSLSDTAGGSHCSYSSGKGSWLKWMKYDLMLITWALISACGYRTVWRELPSLRNDSLFALKWTNLPGRQAIVHTQHWSTSEFWLLWMHYVKGWLFLNLHIHDQSFTLFSCTLVF